MIADLIITLLQQPHLEAQTAVLQTADLLHPNGLAQLLDQAMTLARSKPGQARQLARLCAQLADQAAAPAIAPRAAYIQAQTHALKGELAPALTLIEAAHEGYRALGMDLPAQRTNLGRIHVLNEMGQHQEALQIGQSVLAWLNQNPQFDDAEAQLIAILAHNNIGVCYRRIGQYEAALQAYEAAESRCLASGQTGRLGDIRNNQGLILLHLGRVSEALAAFEAAAQAHAAAGLTLLQAKSRINIGEANLLIGHYTRSLEALTAAQQLLSALDAPADEQMVLLHRADVYLALNLYPEAQADYETAVTALQASGMRHYEARALWGLGSALAAQAQVEAAAQALADAAALFEKAGNAPMLCSVMLEQAALQAEQDNRATAQATAQAALALVMEEDWPVQQMYAHLRLADLALDTPALGAVEVNLTESHLLAAQKLAQTLALPHLQYRLSQRLGHLHRLKGQMDEARRWLETAVAQIEQLRGAVAQEAMRISFQFDKMAAYEELIQLHLEEGDDVPAAFAVAEQAKSRALSDLLAGVVAPEAAVSDAELAELQADLNAAYNELFGSAARIEEAASLSALQDRIRALERDIRQRRLQLGSGLLPDVFTAVPPSYALPRQFPADMTLLAYHIIGDDILAFVQRDGAMQAVKNVGRVTAVHAHLQRLMIQLGRFRAGDAFVQRHMARLEQSAQRHLAALHAELIAPLASHLDHGTVDNPAKLVIIPHGLLHQVPFHALFDGQRYLIDGFEISYAPSTAVFAHCERKEKRQFDKSIILGVSDPLIPAAQLEAQTVAQKLPDGRLYLGKEATMTAFKDNVAGANLLHMACHGLFRADNPLFSSLKLHDGWLTAVDVLPFDLSDALVTLSACESGRSQVVAGDELIGLSRAFLGAGASTLVVSLWLVQDSAAAMLMADWYEQLQTNPNRAAALRAAQLSLKATHAHPYYWAPFVLVGQR